LTIDNSGFRLEINRTKLIQVYTYSFEKLDVWHLAKSLSIDVYKLNDRFPSDERFGLVSQMRRAAISIASNIAEGSSRMSRKDQFYFYTIAYSSTVELLNQLIIACELQILSKQSLEEIRLKLEPITGKLTKLRLSDTSNSTINPKPSTKP